LPESEDPFGAKLLLVVRLSKRVAESDLVGKRSGSACVVAAFEDAAVSKEVGGQHARGSNDIEGLSGSQSTRNSLKRLPEVVVLMLAEGLWSGNEASPKIDGVHQSRVLLLSTRVSEVAAESINVNLQTGLAAVWSKNIQTARLVSIGLSDTRKAKPTGSSRYHRKARKANVSHRRRCLASLAGSSEKQWTVYQFNTEPLPLEKANRTCNWDHGVEGDAEDSTEGSVRFDRKVSRIMLTSVGERRQKCAVRGVIGGRWGSRA
jgi:hypothetical protein